MNHTIDTVPTMTGSWRKESQLEVTGFGGITVDPRPRVHTRDRKLLVRSSWTQETFMGVLAIYLYASQVSAFKGGESSSGIKKAIN